MDNTAALIWGVMFGAVGMGYLVYGKKQRRGVALLAGALLCVFPYFVSNVFLMVPIGVVLMVLPFFLKE
jgi:hypothetical protein